MTRSHQQQFAERLGYHFQNPDYLEEALRHKSLPGGQSNERLEYLGDRVLGLVIADYLFKHYPDTAEGDLSKRLAILVSRNHCATIARKFDMAAALQHDRMDANIAVSENVLANLCEAVIAAIYLDSGLASATDWILSAWDEMLSEMIETPVNAKSELQEYSARRGLGLPTYDIIEQSGPPHKPVITVEVSLGGDLREAAKAGSRKRAERLAAEKLLDRIKGEE